MTLCIGALAQHRGDPLIVLCFDGRATNDYVTFEHTYKFERLSKQFVALLAGPIGTAKEFTAAYRSHLKGRILNVDNVVEELQIPIKKMKARAAERFIGKRFGMSYSEFLGYSDSWPVEHFQRCIDALDKHRTKVQFIIAGFIDGLPFLFTVEDDELFVSDKMSYIGTGAMTAETVLATREQTDMTQLGRALYNVYEAKKTAEINPYVGKDTSFIILRADDIKRSEYVGTVVVESGRQFLEGLYGEYGPKPVPLVIPFPDNGLIEVPNQLIE